MSLVVSVDETIEPAETVGVIPSAQAPCTTPHAPPPCERSSVEIMVTY